MKKYSDLLKSPQWQKKRLEIFKRDNFTCQSCHATEVTLNVHHAVPYRKNTMPWEYENDELITLCEDCHAVIKDLIEQCVEIVYGRCYDIDSATEMSLLSMEIDGMTPREMRASINIIGSIRSLRDLTPTQNG